MVDVGQGPHARRASQDRTCLAQAAIRAVASQQENASLDGASGYCSLLRAVYDPAHHLQACSVRSAAP
jgi:hypothetical protein